MAHGPEFALKSPHPRYPQIGLVERVGCDRALTVELSLRTNNVVPFTLGPAAR